MHANALTDVNGEKVVHVDFKLQKPVSAQEHFNQIRQKLAQMWHLHLHPGPFYCFIIGHVYELMS